MEYRDFLPNNEIEIRVMNKHLISHHDQELRLLIAHNEQTDLGIISSAIQKSTVPWQVVPTCRRELFVEVVREVRPNVVVVEYDFGVFPFLNEARKEIAEVPCIVLSELELPQNALKCGLNIYILKHELVRLGPWLDLLTAAGIFVSAKTDIGKQIELFLRATEQLDPALVASAALTTRARHPDALKEWTEQLEQKIGKVERPHESSEGSDPVITP